MTNRSPPRVYGLCSIFLNGIDDILLNSRKIFVSEGFDFLNRFHGSLRCETFEEIYRLLATLTPNRELLPYCTRE